jgi:hypothetical protein
MSVLRLEPGYTAVELRPSTTRVVLEAAAIIGPLVLFNVLFAHLPLPYGLLLFAGLTAMGAPYVRWQRTVRLDDDGIHLRRSTIRWRQITNIAISPAEPSARYRCVVEYQNPPSPWPLSKVLFFTSTFLHDPDFYDKVNVVWEAWHRHLATLPPPPPWARPA